METLDNTEWDVIIVGTGLQQSLLALALSRSGKKILHIDENDYYGGAEAAFSLQEAEKWAEDVNTGAVKAAFSNVSVTKLGTGNASEEKSSLFFSRAYSLALSPQLIYARSTLLQHLVSSRVYRQLEFLAVGSWWVYAPSTSNTASQTGKLIKVPNGREDVFQDQNLDFKAKRALMKFLRFISEYEEKTEIWESHRQTAFPNFLSEHFKIPVALQDPLLALTLSTSRASETTTEYALPRIARHLRSIGVFGTGFGAVIPKWGGLSEITQVSCRACAVGGGVYVLGRGLSPHVEVVSKADGDWMKLHLRDGEAITAKYVIGGNADSNNKTTCSRSISIISSPLSSLFPLIADEAPPPASAVISFPTGSLSLPFESQELPPVHISVHSSDTGECPVGQSVLYASTSLPGPLGETLLKTAINTLLSLVADEYQITPPESILWSVIYQQQKSPSADILPARFNDRIVRFAPSSLDLAFDDTLIEDVRRVWKEVVGDEMGEGFFVFRDREGYDENE